MGREPGLLVNAPRVTATEVDDLSLDAHRAYGRLRIDATRAEPGSALALAYARACDTLDAAGLALWRLRNVLEQDGPTR